MRLEICPSPTLGILGTDLDLVVEVSESGTPSIHLDPGQPQPDRHLLLGLAQCAAVAVEERDSECVASLKTRSVTLVKGNDRLFLGGLLVLMRNSSGKFGVLSRADYQTAGRLTRRLIWHFTGKIRLDVP